ncbi:unknown [Roseburia sp. CAG:303]|nr:unknown [Roseburia sp. CAG:303]
MGEYSSLPEQGRSSGSISQSKRCYGKRLIHIRVVEKAEI